MKAKFKEVFSSALGIVVFLPIKQVISNIAVKHIQDKSGSF